VGADKVGIMNKLNLVANILLFVVLGLLIADSYKQWEQIDKLTEQHNIMLNDVRNICSRMNVEQKRETPEQRELRGKGVVR